MADNTRTNTGTWGWAALAIVVVAAVLVWGAATNWWSADTGEFEQTSFDNVQNTGLSTGVPIEQIDIQNEINTMQDGDEIVIERDDGVTTVERSWI